MFRISPLVLFFFVMYLAFSHCWVFRYRNGELDKRSTRKKLSEKYINDSITFAIEMYERKKSRETILQYTNVRVTKGSPSYALYQANFPEPEALDMMKESLAAAAASSNLFYERCYLSTERQECENMLGHHELWNTAVSTSCSRLNRKCSKEESYSKFRTYDGSCNNLVNAESGRSFTAYETLIKPNYLAAVREPRRSITKEVLSHPSFISSHLYLDTTPDTQRTLSVLYWAQFVEHDLSHTAMNRMVHSEKLIECCDTEGRMSSPRYLHDFCLPIRISSRDEYYASKDINCLSYVRSMLAVGPNCTLGSTHQINQATHYLDASQIYGATISKHERTLGTNGQMAVSIEGSSIHLPLSEDPGSDCQSDQSTCYRSGDKRVNENPHITALYTLWTREHNRIATELSQLNPTWDQETVFEEARRIVVAEIQHITYTEWIPTVLGMEITDSYEPQVEATISNAFATAAIRAFHSAGSDKRSLKQEEEAYLKDRSKNVEALLKNMVTETFRGKSLQYIGQLNNKNYGYDILSLDIQRGRDHGLPIYNEFRTFCRLKKIDNFDNLEGIMHPQTVRSIRKGYEKVDDIDLIVGGISEIPEKGMFGPTISCILAKQFSQTRTADRYFYTNQDQPIPFNDEQLNEIKKITLSSIICDNTKYIETIVPRVFKAVSDRNPSHLACSTDATPRLNLKFWDANRYTYASHLNE